MVLWLITGPPAAPEEMARKRFLFASFASLGLLTSAVLGSVAPALAKEEITAAISAISDLGGTRSRLGILPYQALTFRGAVRFYQNLIGGLPSLSIRVNIDEVRRWLNC